jgi:GNAT superfamily N-acetyltransferase
MKTRLLTLNDVPAAMELCAEAGWNQTSDDWRMLMERDRHACFGLDLEGALAATTTLVSYGKRLGWIGMVLTRKRFRRRGCARALLERAVELAAARGLETLKLDATELGAPLYTSLGFVEEQPVERWFCERPRGRIPVQEGPADAIPEQLDSHAFGADRTALLQALVGRGSLTTLDGAYAVTRPGRIARYLGPCVAEDRVAAQRVIESAISEGGAWFWDLLPGNPAAVDTALGLGFAPVRTLLRMSRGAKLQAQDENVFAIGGFELG